MPILAADLRGSRRSAQSGGPSPFQLQSGTMPVFRHPDIKKPSPDEEFLDPDGPDLGRHHKIDPEGVQSLLYPVWIHERRDGQRGGPASDGRTPSAFVSPSPERDRADREGIDGSEAGVTRDPASDAVEANVKIFDVVSPRIISGFPDIQNGKVIMLNTFFFSQIHQRSFPEIFTDEEVFHYIDSRPTFNAKTVESFCKKAIEEAMESYARELEGKEGITVPELIELMEREIQAVAERNVQLSSYYPLLERENVLGR